MTDQVPSLRQLCIATIAAHPRELSQEDVLPHELSASLLDYLHKKGQEDPLSSVTQPQEWQWVCTPVENDHLYALRRYGSPPPLQSPSTPRPRDLRSTLPRAAPLRHASAVSSSSYASPEPHSQSRTQSDENDLMDTAEDGPVLNDQHQEGAAAGDAAAEGEPMTAAEFLLHMQRSGNSRQQETHAIEALRAQSAYAAYNEESIVKGAERCRIEEITLESCQYLDRNGLKSLLDHPIRSFRNVNTVLSRSFFESASIRWADTLRFLDLSRCSRIDRSGQAFARLKHLVYLNVSSTAVTSLPPLPSLRYLNLNNCRIVSEALAQALIHTPDLEALYVAKTQIDTLVFAALRHVPRLKRLSLAACDGLLTSPDARHVANNQQILKFFARLAQTPLPLEWLDLSFTSLDEQGLRALLARKPPPEYIGIVRTGADEVANNGSLPPNTRLGAAFRSREEVLNAVREAQVEVKDVVREVLRGAYRYYSPNSTPEESDRLVGDCGVADLAINAMWYYLNDKDDMQLVTSAVLYYISHRRHGISDHVLRRRILMACKRSMQYGFTSLQLAKNMSLTFRNFDPEIELMDVAAELAHVLLRAAAEHNDRTVRLPAISLCCHGLASLKPQVKVAIGNKGTTELVLEILRKVEEEAGDEEITPDNLTFMECCWTFLWNVTDESPINCQQVVAADGLDAICRTLTLDFARNSNILRNVLGLLSNISEVSPLRGALMSHGLVEHLLQILELSQELEATYNATGMLCHLLAEGRGLWAKHNLDHEFERVIDTLIRTVDSWVPTPESWINYRSMKPIAYLLNHSEHWSLSYWACWAINSLCAVDDKKYCPMVIGENIVPQLQRLKEHSEPRLRKVATEAVGRCVAWQFQHQAPTVTRISAD